MTNREFSDQTEFIEKCNRIMGENRQHKHLRLTRQASKFRRKRGIVFSQTNAA